MGLPAPVAAIACAAYVADLRAVAQHSLPVAPT